MFSSFPPFPSPNPAAMNHSPLENAPVVPSPPSSSSSSMVSSPSSTPSTPASPISRSDSGASGPKPARSRSRSTARNSVPPRTRIIKHKEVGPSTNPSAPHSPPITPPLETKHVEEVILKIPDVPDSGILRKKSVRTHHYEDAVRIACGAWSESAQKKKTVSWGDNKQVSA